MRGRRRVRLLLTLSGLLTAPVLLARPLVAQERPPSTDSAMAVALRTVTLAGVVLDSAGHPLSGAEVRAGALQFTISEADGRFLLTGVAPDTIQLLVRRIGYVPAEVVLEARAGLRVELAVKLVPMVTELGTIVVEGRAMDTRLWRTGFYARQRLGRGTLFGPDELEHHGATLTGLMHTVPSVRIARGNFGDTFAYGPSGFGGGQCPLLVFLDGVYIRWADAIGLDQIVDRREILAIEVYPRATQMPAALAGYSGVAGGAGLPSPGAAVVLKGVSSVDCGALVIWTKPFAPKEQPTGR